MQHPKIDKSASSASPGLAGGAFGRLDRLTLQRFAHLTAGFVSQESRGPKTMSKMSIPRFAHLTAGFVSQESRGLGTMSKMSIKRFAHLTAGFVSQESPHARPTVAGDVAGLAPRPESGRWARGGSRATRVSGRPALTIARSRSAGPGARRHGTSVTHATDPDTWALACHLSRRGRARPLQRPGEGPHPDRRPTRRRRSPLSCGSRIAGHRRAGASPLDLDT